MPLYDFHCSTCGKDLIDYMKKISAPAPDCCGNPMEQRLGMPLLDNFKPQYFEHLADKPIFFETKRELRRYCRSNNLTMDYVE